MSERGDGAGSGNVEGKTEGDRKGKGMWMEARQSEARVNGTGLFCIPAAAMAAGGPAAPPSSPPHNPAARAPAFAPLQARRRQVGRRAGGRPSEGGGGRAAGSMLSASSGPLLHLRSGRGDAADLRLITSPHVPAGREWVAPSHDAAGRPPRLTSWPATVCTGTSPPLPPQPRRRLCRRHHRHCCHRRGIGARGAGEGGGDLGGGDGVLLYDAPRRRRRWQWRLRELLRRRRHHRHHRRHRRRHRRRRQDPGFAAGFRAARPSGFS